MWSLQPRSELWDAEMRAEEKYRRPPLEGERDK